MATAYISRTFGTPTDEDKWTLSFWYKKCGPTLGVRVLDADGGGNEGNISFDATTGKLNFYQYHSIRCHAITVNKLAFLSDFAGLSIRNMLIFYCSRFGIRFSKQPLRTR